MGEVYRARDIRLDRIVAIKILPNHLSSRAELRERFDRKHSIARMQAIRVPVISTLRGYGMERTRRDFIRTSVAAGTTFGLSGTLGLDAAQSARAIPMPTPSAKALMALFNPKYPIFEAPHVNRTSPELAIAARKAGAMGASSLPSHIRAAPVMSVPKLSAAQNGTFVWT